MPIQRRSLQKIKKGDLVEITFYDHVSTVGGISEPILCRVIGEVVAVDKKAVYTASWLTTEQEQHNLDTHTILKSVIQKLKKLKR
jgi:hypothetical protein